MENTQHMKTGSESDVPVDTSEGSIKSKLVAVTEKKEPLNLYENTTATMPNASKKTWTSAKLEELRSKAGLVAGALADFQSAGGLVAVKNVEYKKGEYAVKIYLVADGVNIQLHETADGLDFEILPLGSGKDHETIK